MRIEVLAIFLAIVARCFFQNLEHKDAIMLLNDFLKEQKFPTRVTAYICWNKNDQLMLWKTLSINGFPCSILTDDRKFIYPSKEQTRVFFLDLKCPFAENILERAQRLKLFWFPFRWIILGQTSNPLFKPFYFPIDSRIYIMEHFKNNFQIKSIYKIKGDCISYIEQYGNFTEYCGQFVENNIGQWKRNNSFTELKKFTSVSNRSDLMGAPIVFTFTVPDRTVIPDLDGYRNLLNDPTLRVYWKLMDSLTAALNVTRFNLFRNTFGYVRNASGYYDGMFGDLQTGQADIAGNIALIFIERLEFVDYMGKPHEGDFVFVFREPPLTYEANIFTLPFDQYVWYSTYFLAVLCVVIVYIIGHWEHSDPLPENQITEAETMKPAKVSDAVMMEVGAVTQQGTIFELGSISGRFATFLVLLVWMFLFTAYSANIVALLQSTDKSLTSIEAMLNSKMQMGIENQSHVTRFVSTLEEPLEKAVFTQKIAPEGQTPNYFDLHTGMGKVRNEFFAFYAEGSRAFKIVSETFLEHEKCGLQAVRFVPVQTYTAIKKNLSYREPLKVAFLKTTQSGIMRREQALLYVRKPQCDGQMAAFTSVGLFDCYFAFVIFGVGLATGSALLLIETIFQRYHIGTFLRKKLTNKMNFKASFIRSKINIVE